MNFSDFIEVLHAKCNIVRDYAPQVNANLCGAYYIPQSREGKREFVLIFKREVPDSNHEPELYHLASDMDDSNPEEIHLKITPKLEYLLTTYAEDKKFREALPQVIEDNVQFEMFDKGCIEKYYPNQ